MTGVMKTSIEFPDRPYLETIDDIVAVGGRLDTATLLQAYRRGIFPWPQKGYPMLWFFPQRRGILDFNDLHIPKSLAKFVRQVGGQYTFTVNKSFDQVIENCRVQKRPNQDGTWILPEIRRAYQLFHVDGYAHSVECWRDDKLVGGIYGVLVNGVFSGESMFHLEQNTSKLSLLCLIEWLKSQNIVWMDIQMVTPVVEALGGKYISGKEFFHRLPFAGQY
ncbi:MAG: leucyl/phenylalanyl-tRNA--protein transferase [Bdellovibrionaceae bacterium]|nr:leucyl/phenylalanyl-tRNA--protein transferase [Pseudobdellovibrionaceae bacterium]